MYATGTPFSQSSKTINVYNGNYNINPSKIALEFGGTLQVTNDTFVTYNPGYMVYSAS
jgi:hypothetical protein